MTARLKAVMRCATWVLTASGMSVPGMYTVPFPLPESPRVVADGLAARSGPWVECRCSRRTVPQELTHAQSRVADADLALHASGVPPGRHEPRSTAPAVDARQRAIASDAGRGDSGAGRLRPVAPGGAAGVGGAGAGGLGQPTPASAVGAGGQRSGALAGAYARRATPRARGI